MNGRIVLPAVAAVVVSVFCPAYAATPGDTRGPVDLLRQARSAAGGAVWDRPKMLVLTGNQHARGLVARWREAIDLGTGKMHETVDFGIFQTSNVWDGREYWRQGRSGGVHPINSPFAQRLNITNAWLARRGYLDLNGLGAALQRLEDRFDGGAGHVVVRATPVGGEPVELWFDQKSHLLARTVQDLAIGTKTVRYTDYRPVDRALVPFKIAADEGAAADAEIVEIGQAQVVAPARSEFRRPKDPEDFTVAGGRVEVPMEFDGFVVVEAKLNGRGPFAFVLDTGGRAILTPDVARQLDLKLVGKSAGTGAGEGSLNFQYARLDRLDIGGLSLRDQSIAVVPLGFDTVERGAKPAFAGILGLELFERLSIGIDYRNRRLTFEPLNSKAVHGSGTLVPITFGDDMPLVRARIDGAWGDVAIDTGDPEPLLVQAAWAGRNGLKQRLMAGLPLVAAGGVGGPTSLWASRADIELGGATLPRVVTYYADDKSGSLSSRTDAGIVGNDILANFTLLFDYRRGDLWFDRVPGVAPKPYDRAGISVEKPRADIFTVDSVIRGAPADDAGLKVGDEIFDVDGVPAEQMSGWDFGRAIRRPPGTSMVLVVRGKAGRRPVVVKLRELLP